MSRTLIPELIVGAIAFFIWNMVWDSATGAYYIVIETDPTNNALVISAAIAVLIFGLYLIVFVYCFGVCIERVAYFVYDRMKKNKVNDEPV